MPRKQQKLTKKTMTAAEIDVYANYLKGNVVVTIDRPAPPDYRERVAGGVIPFGISPDTTASAKNHVRVTVTRGALGILNALGLLTTADNKFGLISDAAQITDSPEGFYPALAKITLIPQGTVAITTGLSPYTGRKRNYMPGRSGSVPFGRGNPTAQPDAKGKAQATNADIDFTDAAEAIKAAIQGVASFTGKKRVSIEAEVWRAGRPEPAFFNNNQAVAPQF